MKHNRINSLNIYKNKLFSYIKEPVEQSIWNHIVLLVAALLRLLKPAAAYICVQKQWVKYVTLTKDIHTKM